MITKRLIEQVRGQGGRTRSKMHVWSADISDLTLDVLERAAHSGPNAPHIRTMKWLEPGAGGMMGPSWFGLTRGPVGPGICAMLRDGEPKAAEALRQLSATAKGLVPPPISAQRRGRWEEQGDEIDRDRVLSGDLDRAWRTSRRDVALAPLPVTIVSPWGGNAHRSAEQLSWNVAAALAASDLLEDAGYATEIVLVGISATAGGYAAYRLLLKGLGQPVSLPSLAAGAHPGVFRTFGFVGICSAPWDVYLSLGTIITPTRAMLLEAGMVEETDLVLDEAFDQNGAQVVLQRAMESINNVATFGVAEGR